MTFRRLAKKALGIDSWNSDDHQKRAITDAKTIFDVGANIGQSAQTYRRLYPQAEIWSFEPFPSTYKDLCRSISDSKFHPMELALSDRITTAKLNVGAETITNSFLRRQTDTGETVEVQTDTIDHFCRERGISNIDILKVDVEGAEERVFKGAREMFLRGAIRSVFVEVYFRPVYDRMPLFSDLDMQLKKFGFGLRGLYSLCSSGDGFLNFGNALYLRHPESDCVEKTSHNHASDFSFEALAKTGT